MSERVFDEDWDNWKVGDWVVWEDEKDMEPVQITGIDDYKRVFWLEDGEEHMTRAMKLLRVKEQA